MSPYHLRRSEKEIKDEYKLLRIIQGQQFMTLAMAYNDEPYLVTLNYGFDAEEQCFYFHCAHEGKKRDYLARNPIVWGQILEDHGYVATECEHAFRSVHFRGQVTFLEAEDDKRIALELMIDQLEPDPEP
ncbi:MAG: pyridoxamine 5'-phosphate oxidase family protein, partial [Anaerolineae bacterium]|nr:pyridoxamine 5'-phosphate oxidase family protein [Anaerolineae bacterium]